MKEADVAFSNADQSLVAPAEPWGGHPRAAANRKEFLWASGAAWKKSGLHYFVFAFAGFSALFWNGIPKSDHLAFWDSFFPH